MCQLTLLDIDPKTKLGKSTIRLLTELNSVGIVKESLSVNQDGFGYCTFSKAPEIIKTAFPVIDWWKDNEDDYHKSIRNPNGIYHVRSASGNTRTLWQKDAHPFNHGHIVLAHNGTLTHSEKLDEMLEEKKYKDFFPIQKLVNQHNTEIDVPMIDSEKFCKVLAYNCGKSKLSPEHIISTMNLFHGSFAFLIHDTLQPKKVFVVRGDSKVLHEAIIYKGRQKIGLVINTAEWELLYWARVIKQITQNILGFRVKVSVREIPEDSIFIYKIGSYNLGESVAEIEQTIKVVTKSTPTVYSPHGRAGFRGVEYSDDDLEKATWVRIAELSVEMNFSLKELWIVAEVILGQSLHTMTEEQSIGLCAVLEDIKKKCAHEGRKKVWDEWLSEKNLSPVRGYSLTGLNFPSILNSKKTIKAKIKKANATLKKEAVG